VSTVDTASATRLDPVFLKPIGGRRAENLVGICSCCSRARDRAAGPPQKSHPFRLWRCHIQHRSHSGVAIAPASLGVKFHGPQLRGRSDSRSQYVGRILCVDSVLLAGHGVFERIVEMELCLQLQCPLPKK
jgi:hypothetical protein